MFCLASSIAAHGQSITLLFFALKSLASFSHVIYTIFQSRDTPSSKETNPRTKRYPLFACLICRFSLDIRAWARWLTHKMQTTSAQLLFSLHGYLYTCVRMGRIIIYSRRLWSHVTLKHYNLFLFIVHLSVGGN